MTDRRRVLAAVGAVLGIAGAVGALVISPLVALVGALGALVAAGAAMLPLEDTPPTTPETPAPTVEAGDDRVSPVPEAATPRSIGSDQVDTAGAPEGGPSSPSPDPPRIEAVPSPPGGAEPAVATPATALTDPKTGLFSQDYFDIAIDARVAAARRHLRPVGVVMLEVVEGLRAGRVQPTDPKRVAEAIHETLREADTACRRSDGRFALLLEDTPENGAIWTVERIRRFLAERDPTLTLWAGIACYPAHGFSSGSLVKLAGTALGTAREWHQDRIEVAVGE